MKMRNSIAIIAAVLASAGARTFVSAATPESKAVSVSSQDGQQSNSAADGNVRAPGWPQFRGPGARGVATSTNLPDHWSATENVAWKTEVPGSGWSSPVVWGDRVFLTTAVSSGDSEPPKKGLYIGGERRDAPRPQHEWKVFCLELSSGKVRW